MSQTKKHNEPSTFAVAAIMRNEGPYILEWIAFHRSLGVENFIVADNVSDDGSSDLLTALHDVGIIHRIPFPHVPGQAPQLPAYAEIIRLFGSKFEWLAFIDADEFLLPTDGSHRVDGILSCVNEDIGAIAVNWAIYGSSGRVEPGDGLVVERFQHRAAQDCHINKHYKSILRSKAYASNENHPHGFNLLPEYRLAYPCGGTVQFDRAGHSGISSKVEWSKLRLQHYVIKSQTEFLLKKAARGRAMTNLNLRDFDFFRNHDKNDIHEKLPVWLIDSTEREIERIRLLLSENNVPDQVVNLDKTLKDLSLPKNPGKGVIDSFEIKGSVVSLNGWAITSSLSRAETFDLRIGNTKVERFTVTRNARPDVGRHYPGADLHCGFSIYFSVLDIPIDAPTTAAISLHVPEQNLQLSSAAPLMFPADMVNRLDAVVVPTSPSMPKPASEALRDAMKSSRCYLEYGTGGSTLMACEAGVPLAIGVESDWAWMWAVKNSISKYPQAADFHLLYADIGVTHEWGFASNENGWKKWHNYPLGAWDKCNELGATPDVVLIDGRFRAACFFATLLFARPNCRIFFDDYLDRPYYQHIEEHLKPVQVIDRMGLFSVPTTVDRDRVWLSLVRSIPDQR
ncbi:hypothetical protein J2Z19_002082 [Ensifer adhaerens]|uniref:Uncharacterized protein n=1 Tax=Ensifer adhaerens TaxID=106592 RepID=A0ACC5SU65_ENSAD|nr:glycosyltransferase family 2 protein [Ensifer adhaerens]MBP1872370.1 hypothetical protein [Ensifer adhaerens]